MSKRTIYDPSKHPKDANGAYIKAQPAPDLGPFKLDKFLFGKQLKFVEDPRPYKIAVCSRRAGKTIACAAHLIETALNSHNTVSLYITLSRNNAKKLIWPEIQKINRNYKLGGVEDNTELSMFFPSTGSTIYLSGAKDASEIEKFRGLALKLCYIDECQSFREYIQELIDDIISPALLDYAGTLCLIGTPGPIPAGYFAEIAGVVQEKQSMSESWSHHGWTFFDNPWIETKSGKKHEELLERELKRRGVSAQDPSIQREFYGRWVLDSDSLWLHYKADLNHFTELPDIKPHKWNYIMGIDLGFEDADAIAVLAWSEHHPATFLVEEVVVNKQGLTPLVDKIKALSTQYDVSKMVIDEGGLGKKLAEEMRRQHGIPVQAADKARKQENVAFLNDSLRTGRFKANAKSRFAEDTYRVEIDRSKSRPDRIVLSSKYHSDIIDAVLYAFKESPGWGFEPEVKKPARNTKEYAEMQSREMFEAAIDHYTKEAEYNKRIFGENE